MISHISVLGFLGTGNTSVVNTPLDWDRSNPTRVRKSLLFHDSRLVEDKFIRSTLKMATTADKVIGSCIATHIIC